MTQFEPRKREHGREHEGVHLWPFLLVSIVSTNMPESQHFQGFDGHQK